MASRISIPTLLTRFPPSPPPFYGGINGTINDTKVGPVLLDPEVAAEVGELMGDDIAVFGGLVRRDTLGETARVRVEVGREQVFYG